MPLFWLTTALSLGSGLVFFTFFIASYNRLVRQRQRLGASAAQMHVQLQRRHDLIPHLVEAVRGVLTHEERLLAAVLDAHRAVLEAERAHATEAMRQAEAVLGREVRRLVAVLERAPRLHADATVLRLMEELTTTENRVAFARQAYNDHAAQYNARLHAFPHVLVAKLFGWQPAPPFEAAPPAFDAPPARALTDASISQTPTRWIPSRMRA